jgi:cytidine deaminase
VKPIQITCRFSECDPDELPEEDKKLLQQARDSVQKAYAVYSGFRVGAAVLLENGAIVLGNNQENASYPLGLCAERVAMFAANANNPGIGIKAIAISAASNAFRIDKPVTPCGACRQVINEYEHLHKKPIKLIMSGESGKVLVASSIKEL